MRAILRRMASGRLNFDAHSCVRAVIVDCKGYLEDLKNWQRQSPQKLDLESLVSYLRKPKCERMETFRLSIHMQSF